MTKLELEIVTEKPWLSEWFGRTLVVYPLGEGDAHELASEDCDCRPQVEQPRDGRTMLVHNVVA